MTPLELPCAVVGSGPAGVFCALALLRRGKRVVMLDAGMRIHGDALAELQRLHRLGAHAVKAESAPDAFEAEPVPGGVPLKLVFGSDFPYRIPSGFPPVTWDGAGVRPSFARGGLSNVWGATLLSHRPDALSDWPITAEDLAPHHRAVSGHLRVAGVHDGLAEHFPLHTAAPLDLPLSRQGRALLNHMERHQSRLRAEGFLFGRARLALNADEHRHPEGCIQCGRCLSGCPRSIIYSSSMTLEQLQAFPTFTYTGDVLVRSFKESADGVELHVSDMDGHEPRALSFSRVFLAAGVIPTAQLVLESLGSPGPVDILDSQYFLLPFVHAHHVPGVGTEELVTLAQLFLELSDRRISDHDIHLQIYSYNSLLPRVIRKRLGPLTRVNLLMDQVLGRLGFIQGYLHSSESPKVRLHRMGTGDHARLHLQAVLNPRTGPTLRRLMIKLARNGMNLGFLPVPPLLEVATAGRGYHCGGTFPMRRKPGPLQSDALGRLAGLSRVHLADASTFPSLPATTITFTAMANAHRIGSDAP